MTEMTAYPPIAPAWQHDGTGTPEPVLVAVTGPAAQRRATVAIRLILAIPHLLALYFLGVTAFVVVVIGWLGALATGRLPHFAATYLSGYLRWRSRVGAYLLLLTDEYPPFTFEDAAYPVRLAVGTGKLSRLTVAPRIILAIPVAIVLLLLAPGLAVIVIFAGWPSVLVAGRLPAALHQAFAVVLRYNLRYYGYLYLLTGVYPAGLSGDKPALVAPQPGFYGQDVSWQMVLSPGAKRLIGLILVLGLLTAGGAGAWAGATINAIRQRDREISQLNTAVAQFNPVVTRHNAAVALEQRAASQVSNASQALSNFHDTLFGVLNSPASDSTNCSTVSCFDATSLPGAKAFAAFGAHLRKTPIPPGSAAIAKRLATATAGTARDWLAMSDATSFDSFIASSAAAEKDGGHFDSDYPALLTSLSNELTTLDNEATTLDTAATTLNQEAAALNRRAAALNVKISVRTADQGS